MNSDPRDETARTVLLAALREWRTSELLSQREVAQRMGCSPVSVTFLENQDRTLALAGLQQYVRALGLQLHIIITAPSGRELTRWPPAEDPAAVERTLTPPL